ncbi:MAG TPA: hypothetical protein VLS92_02240 [Acidimicrobiia bacterium]|nr:hypothetical protein [Acidimicrobiia bacterium]
MDRAAPAAICLPPVARLTCPIVCVALALFAAFPAPAAARALPPPPQRLAVVWGRPGWPVLPVTALAPPPGRWAAGWAEDGPLALPPPIRSLRGRA